jgi:hypothetical protein
VSQAKPEPRCWDCGAPNDPGARECWLCHRRDWLSGGIVFPSKGGAPRGESRRLTGDQFSKVETAFLLGCLSAAGVLFVVVIVPILTLFSALIGLLRICTGQGH